MVIPHKSLQQHCQSKHQQYYISLSEYDNPEEQHDIHHMSRNHSGLHWLQNQHQHIHQQRHIPLGHRCPPFPVTAFANRRPREKDHAAVAAAVDLSEADFPGAEEAGGGV